MGDQQTVTLLNVMKNIRKRLRSYSMYGQCVCVGGGGASSTWLNFHIYKYKENFNNVSTTL